MKTQQIREAFLGYFERNGHKVVKSSPLLPKDDPTILFTNAGMNQFKDVFAGLEKRSYSRAATVQKCMRVSGKHNDLETVGRTSKHHTFFEMLGNFSFGDYFKEGAIQYGWEFVTEILKLDKDRLYVTIYLDDDEAYSIWNNKIGVPDSRIFRFGKKDNFWAMGDIGPCGPCSELHYDIDPQTSKRDEKEIYQLIESGSDQVVELWNLVFMQFYQDAEGRQSPLPSPSIDTGMGLERLAAVLQNVSSNYSTDLFMPLIDIISGMMNKEYPTGGGDDIAIRIIADHIRAISFLIADGIMPANDGRGYVLRRLIRRAYRQGNLLGTEEPFLYKLVGVVVDTMKEAYPELLDSSEYIARLCLAEEQRFAKTLTSGLRTFQQFVKESRSESENILSGKQAFKLYDTFGFPLDLSIELAAELDMAVDEEGFAGELEKQRQKARKAWKGDTRQEERRVYESFSGNQSLFLGYETEKLSDAEVLGLIKSGAKTDELKQGDEGEIILVQTPFYAESGGQVGDKGVITSPHFSAVVQDTIKPVPELISHRIKVISGRISAGDLVEAEINVDRRAKIRGNHTATHLLHAALRSVLGDHVKQSGSLVSPDRLRFDFTHYSSLSNEEIERVEVQINDKIRDNLPLDTAIVSLEEGVKMGAMSIFEEKYGETVRVVNIPGFSRELCGGIHVHMTGEIGLFKIISESSIAAGMRRIEALTGAAALVHVQEDGKLLSDIQYGLSSTRPDIIGQLQKLKDMLKEADRNNKSLRQKLANQKINQPEEEYKTIAGIKVLTQKVEGLSHGELRDLADTLKNKMKSGIVILGMVDKTKVFLSVAVSQDLTDKIRADSLIKSLSPVVGGGGGGRADFAQAGGSKPDKLEEALEKGLSLIEKQLQ
jgi:alanyl-tRNA synthetase